MNPKDIRNAIAAQCGMSPEERARRNKFAEEIAVALHTETPSKAKHPAWLQQTAEPLENCRQGEPTSFSEWLERNNDSIDPLDRTEATAQWFDNKAKDENLLE